ncbi:hypothetical protein LSH36_53g03063 [Paralvinella palmiformis]|uniref:Uncharacterized protein n=1 Tax=Paralvinella palmiformis TaxID=53620 RepID=A0AAD9K5E3_9ANNE|nr:hypothetical protein LSH36_53g03063 [Paralvinella palmiformis]
MKDFLLEIAIFTMLTTPIVVSEVCDIVNLKGATDDVLNGDYQLYSTTSCTYAVFKHGSRMLYLFRSGDYWMVDSYYHCDIVNDTYAYLKVDDPCSSSGSHRKSMEREKQIR